MVGLIDAVRVELGQPHALVEAVVVEGNALVLTANLPTKTIPTKMC